MTGRAAWTCGATSAASRSEDIRAFHGGNCTEQSYQFLVNTADRTLPLGAFLAEMQAVAGL